MNGKKATWIAAGATAMVAACCIGGTLAVANHPTPASPAVAVGAPSTAATSGSPVYVSPTPAKPATPTIQDGTWTVGEDFPAGTYSATAADGTCYWAIYKSGQNQSLDSVVQNHLGGGHLTVTLKAGQDFETERCGTWTKK